jgi:isocitrate/isopropylmalate dehydrogenase
VSKNVANPTSSILLTTMLLDGRARRNRNRELVAAAALLEQRVDDILQNPATYPRDMAETVQPTRSQRHWSPRFDALTRQALACVIKGKKAS